MATKTGPGIAFAVIVAVVAVLFFVCRCCVCKSCPWCITVYTKHSKILTITELLHFRPLVPFCLVWTMYPKQASRCRYGIVPCIIGPTDTLQQERRMSKLWLSIVFVLLLAACAVGYVGNGKVTAEMTALIDGLVKAVDTTVQITSEMVRDTDF